MRIVAVVVAALLLGSVLAGGTGTAQMPRPPQPVTVENTPLAVTGFPATQQVAGTVNVGNLPATQQVAGTVNVGNFPATQHVSGSVSVPQPGYATHIGRADIFSPSEVATSSATRVFPPGSVLRTMSIVASMPDGQVPLMIFSSRTDDHTEVLSALYVNFTLFNDSPGRDFYTALLTDLDVPLTSYQFEVQRDGGTSDFAGFSLYMTAKTPAA